MVLPFLAYILGLFAIGFIHTLLSPVADAFFNASTNTGAVMTMLQAAWNYFPIFYAIIAGMVLILYASKKGGGMFG